MDKEQFLSVKNSLPPHVKLVAVTKTHPPETVLEAYRLGHKIFGENKVQELVAKQQVLPGDIEWHLIGHLQTNKVKFIVPFISMIQSVDSLKLMQVINSEAAKIDRVINCLLEFHIAGEETKFGLNMDEARKILESDEYKAMKNVRICGVMGMASFTSDRNQIRKEFRSLVEIFQTLRSDYFADSEYFREISMGMSGDYKIAIEEGATIVRLGTILFGERIK
ncbi:MAG TPA: YggS family pyridoxal phosphate-dependent enzyme [Bacteroidales bacterium]|nr:YggS family pyridoxal phosphate-dependent enzyme [Bacteroidales bacterium]HQH41942.1 YggS family pyridoxal phosphate-dependent enzyme [Bacteroidales bacterium]HQK38002.1 YggS family pyridoxal phosphate-dependent enzyme [Bacteroidales bacterium]